MIRTMEQDKRIVEAEGKRKDRGGKRRGRERIVEENGDRKDRGRKSESEMAPNAEEELLAVKPWGPQPEKERLRPPTYNAEDYAIALRRWGRRPTVTSHESHGTLPSTTSSSSGYASACGEMTLRQFTSVSELLNKLRADLRLAFPSFVQEFAAPPADGMTLLLETLRGVQLIQSSPPSGQGGPRIGTRRAALDELGCVECLAACGERCPDAPRLLSQAQPGLLALAVCLTSSLNRSRVLALQLLTKVCQAPGGHLAVSEAVSTLRLRYGEGGRFRFLAGALLAPRAAMALRVAGISFLNAFLKSAPRTQTRLYIQAEACEAGLEPRVLQSWLSEVDVRSDDSLSDLLHKEVQKWSHNCVDVEALQKRLARAEETCTILGNKVSVLQEQLDKYNTVKMSDYASGSEDRKIESMSKNSSVSEGRKIMQQQQQQQQQQAMSSNAEDEGISSSERSSSPEELGMSLRQGNNNKMSLIDNDQETTIDDVIEELRIIVKDAEEEFEDRKVKGMKNYPENSKGTLNNAERNSGGSRISIKSASQETPKTKNRRSDKDSVTYFGPNEDEDLSVDSAVTRKLSSSCSEKPAAKNSPDQSVKIMVKNPEFEDAIVPAILYPQPPRRAPPCLSTILASREADFLDNPIAFNNHEEEDIEEETLDDGSDSLLSASRLKYVTKNESTEPASRHLGNQNFYKIQSSSQRSNNSRNDPIAGSRESSNLQNELKAMRNFDDSSNFKNLRDSEPASKYFQVYKQFESNSKVINDCSVATQKRSSSRYKSELERRKSLRRSASQDFLGSSGSSPNSGKSRIESRIRKFESLNAFENMSLRNYSRWEENENEKITRFDGPRSRIKRSESFHHVSMAEREEKSFKSCGGGSDSGLVYITDYDLEPLVNRKNERDGFPQFAHLLTKSLDRIDESFDAMTIEEAFSPSKRSQTSRPAKQKHGKSSKVKSEEKSSGRGGNCKSSGKKSYFEKGPKREEQIRIESCSDSKFLRSDELYDDAMRIERQWNFQNNIDDYRTTNKFSNAMTVGSNQSSSRADKNPNKYSTNDSGVFLPSGRYDAFGLGKNRFNVGKYSGHSQITRDDNVGARKNSTASLVAKHGKVTDILSGLY
ncbi:uncharacterized protein mwh isoform X2 [Venturia canescens]|uniref:uncharacterized protein mwh isoform X2 n=1 Tax=Venturia canescens TaxID=32260 RepID=UPI001C9CAD30|nr:uncharacterized protein LOC122413028 isoform X2 [Venturia canescens]